METALDLMARLVDTFENGRFAGSVPNGLTYPDGQQVAYEYDALDRLSSVRDRRGATYRYSYASGALPVRLEVDGSGGWSAEQDVLGRIRALRHVDADGSIVAGFGYAYDARGNVTTVRELGSIGDAERETHGYDALSRLVSVSGPFGESHFTYDGVGNRLSSAVNGRQQTATFDAADQLIALSSSDGKQALEFAYDRRQRRHRQHPRDHQRHPPRAHATTTRWVLNMGGRLITWTGRKARSPSSLAAPRGLVGRQPDLFAAEGAAVCVGDIDATGGERTVADITAQGGQALFVRTDVSSAGDAERLVAATVERWSAVHVLHNNAYWARSGQTVVTLEEADWDRTLDVSLKGMYLMSRAVVPHMLRAGGGSIVNMASAVGLMGTRSNPAYAAAKGAVI